MGSRGSEGKSKLDGTAVNTANEAIRPYVTGYTYVTRDPLEIDSLTPRYELGREFPVKVFVSKGL